MKTTRRLLTTLITVIMFSFCFGTTAYASELPEAADQPSDTEITEEGQELVLEDGYFMDEQGQIYYDPSRVNIEEPVIEDIPEEDTQEPSEDTAQEVSDTTAEASDDQTAPDNNKESGKSGKTDHLDKADNSGKASASGKDKSQKQEQAAAIQKPSYSASDLRLLSSLIYAEAGGQSYSGMLGVANVVLNRVKSDVYWHVNTIKEVIYDHKWSVQFAVTIKNSKTGLSILDKALRCYDTGEFSGPNPSAEKKAMERAVKAAKAALSGKNNIGTYLCFTNKRSAGSIKRKFSDYKIIDDQIFYRSE